MFVVLILGYNMVGSPTQSPVHRVFFQDAGHLDMLYDVPAMLEQLEGVEAGAGDNGMLA